MKYNFINTKTLRFTRKFTNKEVAQWKKEDRLVTPRKIAGDPRLGRDLTPEKINRILDKRFIWQAIINIS